MNEQELRDGLRQVMAVSSQPPTMNPNTALDAARRAHKRRRATWAGAGAGAAVVALAAGTVFALAPSGDSLPIGPAASGPGLAPPSTGAAEADGSTKTSWPNGQVDRTARNGARADTADAVLAALKAAVAPTLAVDEKRTYPNSDAKVTGSQASFEDRAGPDKQEVWQYLVTVAVTSKSAPAGGTGRVMALVYTPGNTYPADVCQLTPKFWGAGGQCETKVVQGKTVGVVAKPEDSRVNTVVGYRYDDGTVVFVAQSKDPDNEEGSPAKGSMATPPLTIDQLAPMVLNPAFKVT
ncbi:hypothetical protein KIPE111705_08175 [Kibdelosporangium persicum]|uniref:Uncharacterized protein n=1 Tax=Kibdelosporangium persicum TaxID=2698649 RepID=A0ABX2F269_9PSEU|nr:hypothetical protein [Kibdelosporangium persicum]NRN65397.1 hypothetical protein [Kibdelosporangium persicum]